jgi:hypothetical protein
MYFFKYFDFPVSSTSEGPGGARCSRSLVSHTMVDNETFSHQSGIRKGFIDLNIMLIRHLNTLCEMTSAGTAHVVNKGSKFLVALIHNR